MQDGGRGSAAPFFEAAEGAVARLAAALLEVSRSGGVADATSPTAIAQALGVDIKLAWKLARIADVSTPLDAVPYLPGEGAIEGLVKRARARGVAREALDEVRSAADAVRALVELHAGDRASFEVMAGLRGTESRRRIDSELRRAAFEANRRIAGIHTRLGARLALLAPGSDPACMDLAVVSAEYDTRSLRDDAAWTVQPLTGADGPAVVEPLDPEGCIERDGCVWPLMRDFCSSPLPRFRRVQTASGTYVFEAAPEGIGNLSLVTTVQGQVLRNGEGRFATEARAHCEWTNVVGRPREMLVMDLGVHREIQPKPRVEAAMYTCMLRDSHQVRADKLESERLALHDEVIPLGSGLSCLRLAPAAVWPQAARFAFERLGWNPDEFTFFRLRVEYPPSPCVMLMKIPLPRKK